MTQVEGCGRQIDHATNESGWNQVHCLENLESRLLLAGDLGPTSDPTADNDPTNARTFGTIISLVKGIDSVEKGDRVDFYHFELNDVRAVAVKLDKLDGKAKIILMRNSGPKRKRVIAKTKQKRRGAPQEQLITKTLDAGGYLVKVVGGRRTQTDYRLQINSAGPFSDPTQALEDDVTQSGTGGLGSIFTNNTREAAVPIGTVTGRQVFNDAVGAFDGDDYFRVFITDEDEVVFRLDNIQGDVNMQLLSSSGTVIVESTPRNALTDEIRGEFNRGLYYLRIFVEGAPVTDTNYRLTTIGEGNFPEPGPDDYFIEVVFNDNSLNPELRSLFVAAAARWSQIITGDLPDTIGADGSVIDDLRIECNVGPVDGRGGVLAFAGPTAFDGDLPTQGTMTMDAADLGGLFADGTILDVITHEMGHVLGIGTLWDDLVEGAGTDDPQFTGENAVREYRYYIQEPDDADPLTESVPVANTGGPGTRDSHWREAIFGRELMTGFNNGGVINAISRITVGSLEDIGYEVDYDAADDYNVPGFPPPPPLA